MSAVAPALAELLSGFVIMPKVTAIAAHDLVPDLIAESLPASTNDEEACESRPLRRAISLPLQAWQGARRYVPSLWLACAGRFMRDASARVPFLSRLLVAPRRRAAGGVPRIRL